MLTIGSESGWYDKVSYVTMAAENVDDGLRVYVMGRKSTKMVCRL